jgi:hypothetical protein
MNAARYLAAPLLAFALALAVDARAAGVDPDAATPVQREQAQARFARGRKLYDKKRYEEALVEFQGSHDIVASPNARLYIGYCHRELGHFVAAYVELGRTATEARERAAADPRYAKAADSAERERAAVAPRVGFVTVAVAHAAPDTKLTIAGEEIKSAAWAEPAPVMPGTTEIVVSTPGRPDVHQNVSVAAGEKKDVALDAGLPPPPPEPPPEPVAAPPPPPEGVSGLRIAAYVAGGVGVLGLGAFTFFGLKSNSTYNSLQSDCHGPCPASRSNDISSGKSQQTIANVGLIVGAVGVATGVTLFILSSGKHESSSPAPSAALVASPTWLGVKGAF